MAKNNCKANKGSFRVGQICPGTNVVAYCSFPSGAAFYRDVYYKGHNIKKAKDSCAKDDSMWEDAK